jgi:hypothetical protein
MYHEDYHASISMELMKTSWEIQGGNIPMARIRHIRALQIPLGRAPSGEAGDAANGNRWDIENEEKSDWGRKRSGREGMKKKGGEGRRFRLRKEACRIREG